MTKQEEIREGLAYRYAKRNHMDYVRAGGLALGSLPQECYDYADGELKELHSQGVVILVEREQKYSEQTGALIEPIKYKMLEPLIKE